MTITLTDEELKQLLEQERINQRAYYERQLMHMLEVVESIHIPIGDSLPARTILLAMKRASDQWFLANPERAIHITL